MYKRKHWFSVGPDLQHQNGEFIPSLVSNCSFCLFWYLTRTLTRTEETNQSWPEDTLNNQTRISHHLTVSRESSPPHWPGPPATGTERPAARNAEEHSPGWRSWGCLGLATADNPLWPEPIDPGVWNRELEVSWGHKVIYNPRLRPGPDGNMWKLVQRSSRPHVSNLKEKWRGLLTRRVVTTKE